MNRWSFDYLASVMGEQKCNVYSSDSKHNSFCRIKLTKAQVFSPTAVSTAQLANRWFNLPAHTFALAMQEKAKQKYKNYPGPGRAVESQHQLNFAEFAAVSSVSAKHLCDRSSTSSRAVLTAG